MKRSQILFTIIFLFVALSAQSQSQSSFKRTTATILFSSIGGGVLGLSTLSFYGKPQEHTDNITTGVLIGFIAGLSYVLYDNYGMPLSERSTSHPLWTQTQKQFLVAHFEIKKREPELTWPLFSYHHNW